MMGPPPPGMNPIRDAVNVPGILLITYGALSVAYALFSVAVNAITPADANAAQFNQVFNDPNIPPALKDIVRSLSGSGGKVLGLGVNLLNMALGGVIAFGGFQMRNLKSYSLAMAASIISVVPLCGGCCCLLGIPLGIWSISTLMRPEVKAAFT